MKLTTAAILACACTSVFAYAAPYERTAVYARDLYERESGEGALGSFERHRRVKRKAPTSLGKSIAGAIGTMGGRVAGNAATFEIQKKIKPTQTTPPPQQPPHRRRSLEARLKRRRINPSILTAGRVINTVFKPGSPGRIVTKAKGIATAFMNGVASGLTARDLEGVLDELD